MAVPKLIADFETQLTSAISAGSTSFTILSVTDDDGVTIPDGKYYLTVDSGSSNKEYFVGTLTGATKTVASVSNVSRQGVETSGAVRSHRVGVNVKMTDFATYKNYMDETSIAGASNATTTLQGLVELATQAEVDADTGTGGTGASTVPTPAVLAASKYGTRLPTADQKSALQGDTTPDATNKFLTKGKLITAGETINGATLPVPIYQNKIDNEFYVCDANDATKYKFLGFAISNGTDGNSMYAQFSGIVSGFSGLDEGQKYYVSDTAGTISNTPGTQEILVGIAISTTEILIQKGKFHASGTTTFTASSTTTITTGFRPSKVTIYALGNETSVISISNGAWTVLGGNDCVYVGLKASSTEASSAGTWSAAWRLVNGSGTEYHQGSVSNITDTAFDLVNVETTNGITANILWEAEGEL